MQVSVFLGLSLDGYIAREDFGLDWLSMVETVPPEDTGYAEFWASVDVMVMGRHTYDSVLSFTPWPYAGKPLVVLSTRPTDAQHGETFHAGPLPGLIEDLRQQGHRRAYLDGGVVVQQGLEAGLVSDMTLSWLPVVLGSGRPLFRSGLPESRWTLTASRSFPSGLVQARYQHQS
jgi:dihydrofolate reductase